MNRPGTADGNGRRRFTWPMLAPQAATWPARITTDHHGGGARRLIPPPPLGSAVPDPGQGGDVKLHFTPIPRSKWPVPTGASWTRFAPTA